MTQARQKPTASGARHPLWRLLSGLVVLLVLAAAALLSWLLWPREAPESAALPAPEGQSVLTLQWLGVSAVLLRDPASGSAVMIDPFFSRGPDKLGLLFNRPTAPDEAAIRRWLARLGVERLDAVAVSHSHYDHALDAGVVARDTGALLIGSQSTANIGRGAGLDEARIRTPEAGQPVQAGAFRLRLLPSRHAGATGGRPRGDIDKPLKPPAGPLAYRQGGTFSIVIEHANHTVLHHGSAGFVDGVLDGVCADTVVLGVALIDDLDRYLQAVPQAVGASNVLAVHWDDFTRPLAAPLAPLPLGVDLPAFRQRAAALLPGARVIVPPLAKALPLGHGRCRNASIATGS